MIDLETFQQTITAYHAAAQQRVATLPKLSEDERARAAYELARDALFVAVAFRAVFLLEKLALPAEKPEQP